MAEKQLTDAVMLLKNDQRGGWHGAGQRPDHAALESPAVAPGDIAGASWAMFAHWCTLASVGNLLAYVPIRTFTHRDDMGSVERGFGWSPWVVVVLPGIPTLLALDWFFVRAVPEAMEWLFPQSRARRYLVATLTCGFMFSFYGAVGFLNDASSAREMSFFAVLVAMPLTLVLELMRLRRPPPRPSTLQDNQSRSREKAPQFGISHWRRPDRPRRWGHATAE